MSAFERVSLKMEIARDFGREYLRREFKYKGHQVIVLKESIGGPFSWRIEGARIRQAGYAQTGPMAETKAKEVLDGYIR